MNAEIIEKAKALKDHAWLARFRKADGVNNYNQLSPCACNDIAGYVDELLSLIIPPEPTPAVDWGKPIQYRNQPKFKVRLISTLDHPTTKGQTRVLLEEDDEHFAAVFRKEDGRSGYKPDWDIINTPAPAPVEVEFEVCIATHAEHGTCIGYRACGKPTIDIDGPNFEWSYDDEDDAEGWEWNLSPWQRMKVGG